MATCQGHEAEVLLLSAGSNQAAYAKLRPFGKISATLFMVDLCVNITSHLVFLVRDMSMLHLADSATCACIKIHSRVDSLMLLRMNIPTSRRRWRSSGS